jgi:hypothetical protein
MFRREFGLAYVTQDSAAPAASDAISSCRTPVSRCQRRRGSSPRAALLCTACGASAGVGEQGGGTSGPFASAARPASAATRASIMSPGNCSAGLLPRARLRAHATFSQQYRLYGRLCRLARSEQRASDRSTQSTAEQSSTSSTSTATLE